MMDFESKLQAGMFSQGQEKTFIDKVLSRQDVESIRNIIKKKQLSREDVLEILYLISGVESKLLNYGEWDRYVILKFFVWLREFAKIMELIYDYEDKLFDKANTCSVCGGRREIVSVREKQCFCDDFVPVFVISERTNVLFENNKRLMEHNLKFLVDLYLNIGRTSLSVGATGLMEILKNKYEIFYPSSNTVGGGREMQGTQQVVYKG